MEPARRLVRARRILAILVAVPLTACQGTSLYEWGGYEASVYEVTRSAGEVDVAAEIERLTQVVVRSRERDKPVPPGLHAHLGYLYSLSGDLDSAVAAFESEKEQYPEATVFVDGVLARMRAERP